MEGVLKPCCQGALFFFLMNLDIVTFCEVESSHIKELVSRHHILESVKIFNVIAF